MTVHRRHTDPRDEYHYHGRDGVQKATNMNDGMEVLQGVAEWWDAILNAFLMLMIGVLIAVGQYLRELPPRPPLSVLFGRAMATGGLAIAAGAALAFIPTLSLVGQIGIAAALASLGMSGIELLLRRVFGPRE